MIDSRTLTNDEFGYSAYTLVAMADPQQVASVDGVRNAIGLKRATIQAHVTIRGTFFAIPSLDDLRTSLRQVASEQSLAQVQFSAGGWKFLRRESGRHAAIMPCETTADLLDLNEAFDSVIRPISTNAYSDEYRAHLTLCQDCTDEQIDDAERLAQDLDIGDGFEVGTVSLMGRVGPAFGGEWKPIDQFGLGG